jgi:erythronate-4-phosphate dehydrogenase
VRFVATATIGTDHVDQAYLYERGIGFASADGSNANSVAEYVVTAMLEIAHRNQFRLRDKALGVVGVGNVGRRVVRYAEALGMRVLQNDPPRERAEVGRDRRARREGDGQPGGLSLPQFASLERLLAEADIITLHVPLTRVGQASSLPNFLPEDATFHLFDKDILAALELRKPILINTARGAVVDNQALLEAIVTKKLSGVVLDVWENEPNIRADLLAAVDLGTAHIAGYSFDGKLNGTQMIYRAVCGFFGMKPTWEPALPPPPVPHLEATAGAGEDDEDVLRRVIKHVYDITADDAALRKSVRAPDEIGASFDKSRAEYPVRREFFNTELTLRGAGESLRQKTAALGFRL